MALSAVVMLGFEDGPGSTNWALGATVITLAIRFASEAQSGGHDLVQKRSLGVVWSNIIHGEHVF